MNKFYLRLLLFIIFIPSLILIIFKFNFLNYLLLNLIIIAFAVIGSIETNNIFKTINKVKQGLLLPIISGTLPALAYLMLWYKNIPNFIEVWLILILILIFIRTIFFRCRKDFSNLFTDLSSSIIVVIYPSLFLSYLIRILAFENSSFVIIFFLGLVFGNDICAYLGGKFLGSKTKLNLLISPNKTLIGFITGIGFSIIFTIIVYNLMPQLFNVNIGFGILFTLIIAIATIIGDLIESAMKRAANLKDSGFIMLGRGGILDSIDSILISAPIFYFLYPLISG